MGPSSSIASSNTKDVWAQERGESPSCAGRSRPSADDFVQNSDSAASQSGCCWMSVYHAALYPSGGGASWERAASNSWNVLTGTARLDLTFGSSRTGM
ncbi:hypothetical protein EYF80_026946 [Liparis tanakae]|uniref:Uncharacterized protein n=1 Tax=Liparis tanakae TaxID=230148 RepID=A0A4Z2HB70_9TELE|nr:hypothetical protein EYF80_026946 [Liparis tanakae]